MVAASLLTFLDDHTAEIVKQTEQRLQKRWRSHKAPKPAFHFLLARLFDGYVDKLVTDESPVLDRLYRALIPLLGNHGMTYSNVFDVPLTFCSVVRGLLMDDYDRRVADPANEAAPSLAQLKRDIDQIEKVAHNAAGALLDRIQEHIGRTVADHNMYLQNIGAQAAIQIEPLRFRGHIR